MDDHEGKESIPSHHKFPFILLLNLFLIFLILGGGGGYYLWTVLKERNPLSEILCENIIETSAGSYCRSIPFIACEPELEFEVLRPESEWPDTFRTYIQGLNGFVNDGQSTDVPGISAAYFHREDLTDQVLEEIVKEYAQYLQTNQEMYLKARDDTFLLGENKDQPRRSITLLRGTKGSIQLDFNDTNKFAEKVVYIIPVRTANGAQGYQATEAYCEGI